VSEFTAGHVVWDQRRAAAQASAVMLGPLDAADAARARELRLRLEPLTLQQVVVHAASRPGPAASASDASASDAMERTIA
jgi:ABC-2 type transport system ATP-binding protein